MIILKSTKRETHTLLLSVLCLKSFFQSVKKVMVYKCYHPRNDNDITSICNRFEQKKLKYTRNNKQHIEILLFFSQYDDLAH